MDLDAVRDDWSLLATDDDPELISEWLRAVQTITQTFISKNKDYGSSNIGSAWVNGVVVRMGDKISRLWNLTLNEHTNEIDESVSDTLLDIAAYSIIGYLMVQGHWEKTELDNSVGLPALVDYWLANNELTDEQIGHIMGSLISQDMVNAGFPGELK